jgi:cytochrome P450
VGAITANRPDHVSDDRVVDFNIYDPPGMNHGGLHEAWMRLHRPGIPDLIWTPHNGGHWIATRYKDLAHIYADRDHFSSDCIVVPRMFNDQIPSGLKQPLHREFRVLIGKGLSARGIEKIESRMRALTVELIEKVRPKGSCNFMADFAKIFPVHVFLGLTNLPLSDAPMLTQIADSVTHTDSTEEREEGIQAMRDYFEPLIDERLGKNDDDDLFTHVVNGTIQGRPITRTEILRVMSTVLTGGLDTTVNALGFMMHFLAQHPVHRGELVQQMELIPGAIEEMLRRFPLVVLGREVAQDMEYDGVALKRGDMVILPTMLGGLDDRIVDRPLEVDFHRSECPHVTFGNGMHKCAGAHLSRTEIKVVLEEWLKRIPEFELESNVTVEYASGITASVNRLPLVWSRPN